LSTSGQGDLFAGETARGTGAEDAGGETHASRILAGHERGAGRGAERSGDGEVGEAQPFGRHAVKVRSADVGGAVGGDVTVAEIVAVDENDIGPGRHRRAQRAGDDEEQAEQQDYFLTTDLRGRIYYGSSAVVL